MMIECPYTNFKSSVRFNGDMNSSTCSIWLAGNLDYLLELSN